jgi:hypothetical protein
MTIGQPSCASDWFFSVLVAVSLLSPPLRSASTLWRGSFGRGFGSAYAPTREKAMATWCVT